MNFRILIAIAVLSALLVSACGSPPAAQTYARPEALVEASWLAAHLGDANLRILDLSGRRATYDQGHIAGAHYTGVQEWANPGNPLSAEVLATGPAEALLSRLGITPRMTVVLYDDNRSLTATRVFWALKYYRHDDVRILNGGRQKWLRENRPMTAAVPAVSPAVYRIQAQEPALRVTGDGLLTQLGRPGFVPLDVRSPAEYAGKDIRAKRGGHIPGAMNVEWTNAMQDDDTFKSVAQLRVLYGAMASDNSITTYCQTGVRAAHTWFVLTYLLGYHSVAVYDGSWEEWGNRTDWPVQN